MKKAILIVCCLICKSVIAQTTAYISIKNTKKDPIPYTHVVSATHKIVFVSNEVGGCEVIIPNPDSVIINAIGYEKEKIYVNNGGRYDIELKEISYRIDTVSIMPKVGKEEKVGAEKRNSKLGLCSSNGLGYITVLNLSHSGEFARLKEVKFYVLKKGQKDIRKVRLGVFSCVEEVPTKEILKQSIIIEVKKKGWNTIDLSKYDVYVPRFFAVGIEFIENEYYSDFCLGLSDKYSGQNKTWVKRAESFWLQFNFLQKEEKQLNLMLNATLEIYQ